MNRTEPALLRQVQFYAFAAFLFSSTFSIAISQLSFGLSLAVYLTRIAFLRGFPPGYVPTKIYLWIGLYVVWMIIASLLGETPVRSLLILKEEWLFAVIPVGLSVMNNPRDRKRMVTILAVSVLAMSIYGIVQSQTGWHLMKPGEPRINIESGVRISGNFSHPLTYANYFGLAGAFLFGYLLIQWQDKTKGYRVLFLAASTLALVASFLTQTRIIVPSVLVVLLVAAFVMGRRYFMPLAAGLVIVLLSVGFISGLQQRFINTLERELSQDYKASRIFVWTKTAQIIQSHPIFGVGQGNFAPEYRNLLPPEVDSSHHFTHAHNDPLNIAAICGIPGMLFFLGFFVAVTQAMIRGLRRARDEAEPRSYLIAGLLAMSFFSIAWLTEATFADEEVRQLLMFIWAITLAATYKTEPIVAQNSG